MPAGCTLGQFVASLFDDQTTSSDSESLALTMIFDWGLQWLAATHIGRIARFFRPHSLRYLLYQEILDCASGQGNPCEPRDPCGTAAPAPGCA